MKKIFTLFMLVLLIFSYDNLRVSAAENNSNNNYKESIKLKKYKKENKNKKEVTILLQYECESLDIKLEDYVKDEKLFDDLDYIKRQRDIYRSDVRDFYANCSSSIETDIKNYALVQHSSAYSPFIIVKTNYKNLDYLINKEAVVFLRILPDQYTFTPQGIPTGSESTSGDHEFMNTTGILDVKQEYSVHGTGVTIGIYDGGAIDENHVEFDSKTIIGNIGTTSGTNYQHANDVGMIASGDTSGVADNSDLIVRGIVDSSPAGFYSDIEDIITDGADVINMSLMLDSSEDGVTYGEYDTADVMADYLIQNSKVLIVKSAGNRGDRFFEADNDNFITTPGLGRNVITVGSTSPDGKELSTFSSFREDTTNDGEKPTILAPGGQQFTETDPLLWFNTYTNAELYLPNGMLTIPRIGTSFSAPQVTGAVALMFEEKPSLLTSPERVINLLIAGASFDDVTIYTQTALNSFSDESCTDMISTTNGLSEYCGAGLMNLSETFRLMDDDDFVSYINSMNELNLPTVIREYSVDLVAGDNVRISHVYTKNVELDVNGDVVEETMSNYNICVVDPDNNSTCLYSMYSNIDIIDFVAPTTGEYIILIILVNKNSVTSGSSLKPNFGSVVVNKGSNVTIGLEYYYGQATC
jgi:hypothetical protein